MNVRRVIGAAALVVAITGCGDSAAPGTTPAPSATVVAATVPATSTTAGPKQLSRDAQLAVIDCLSALGAKPSNFTGFLRVRESIGPDDVVAELDKVIAACDTARTQVLADDPQSGDPGSDLAVAEKNLSDSLTHLRILYGLQVVAAQTHDTSDLAVGDDIMKIVQDDVDRFVDAATAAGVTA